MLKYLIIQLCDSAPSFCHYNNDRKKSRLISLDDLNSGLVFGMKENLNIQILYPDYEIPAVYKERLDSVDHVDIISFSNRDKQLKENSDIIIFDSWNDLNNSHWAGKDYVLRTSKEDFFAHYRKTFKALSTGVRLNIVFTDIPTFKDKDFENYKKILAEISHNIVNDMFEWKSPQINILTDRMVLKEMNNCNAGYETLTLAPDGNFYICPAFYLDGFYNVGTPKDGLRIKNQQLFKLEYAPICRKCDAYHCKRCVWLNHKQTLEINTPGHEQCVMSHLERNQTRNLLFDIRKEREFLPDTEIPEITYLDPFEVVNKWK